MKFLLLIAMLATSGCAELVATAMIDARDLHERGRTFLGDIYDARVEARRECRAIIRAMADDLVAAGEHEAAIQLWASYYPRLVSHAAVKAAIEGDADYIDQATGCEKRAG